ncbi:MAG: type II secretion system minor pseudopilin GspK [Betaproteobacteria bacterium]|nr:type II secretion system minor pseudopilin GspK [Betaproteobacteria bacterium]
MNPAQQGVAIVMAMSVVALAAIATTAMMTTQSTWSRQSELEVNHAQAQVLIQAGVDWARAVLSDDRRLNNVDHLKEPWALRLPPMPVDNGELAGYIEDQQGAFNLNNLVTGGKISVVQLERFRRLLSILGLPTTLAYALADWIDADNDPQPNGGGEDEYYLSLQPPYLAANRPLTDVAELALVRGFNDEVRARLSPFVSALPANTAVNVNTASPEVLSAVIEGLDLDAARALVAQRERVYFRDYSDFSSRLPRGIQTASNDLMVSSNYFVARVRVSIGGAEARGVALLVRPDVGWPAIVWRKYQ